MLVCIDVRISPERYRLPQMKASTDAREQPAQETSLKAAQLKPPPFAFCWPTLCDGAYCHDGSCVSEQAAGGVTCDEGVPNSARGRIGHCGLPVQSTAATGSKPPSPIEGEVEPHSR